MELHAIHPGTSCTCPKAPCGAAILTGSNNCPDHDTNGHAGEYHWGNRCPGRKASELLAAIQEILNTLAAIIGTGARNAPKNIAYQILFRFHADAVTFHNTGKRIDLPDTPSDDLGDEVPEHLKEHAGTIMLALCRIIRECGGPENPEVGIPMAYAAQAVLTAQRQADRSER